MLLMFAAEVWRIQKDTNLSIAAIAAKNNSNIIILSIA